MTEAAILASLGLTRNPNQTSFFHQHNGIHYAVVNGSDGDDTLSEGVWSSGVVFGYDGDDILSNSNGSKADFVGGDGSDTFSVYNTQSSAVDYVIRDFQIEHDLIQFNAPAGISLDALISVSNGNSSIFTLGDISVEVHLEAGSGFDTLVDAIDAGANESTGATVTLIDYGVNKIAVIQAIRSITGLGLAAAKNLAETPNSVILEDASQAEAAEAFDLLTAAGGNVALTGSYFQLGNDEITTNRHDGLHIEYANGGEEPMGAVFEGMQEGAGLVPVIQAIRAVTGLGLLDARNIAETEEPVVFLEDLTGADLATAITDIEAAGGIIRANGVEEAISNNGQYTIDFQGEDTSLFDGTNGNDTLKGAEDSDIIFGFGGDDILSGTQAGVRLAGGEGRDMFVISDNSKGQQDASIIDFQAGEDVIDLSQFAITSIRQLGFEIGDNTELIISNTARDLNISVSMDFGFSLEALTPDLFAFFPFRPPLNPDGISSPREISGFELRGLKHLNQSKRDTFFEVKQKLLQGSIRDDLIDAQNGDIEQVLIGGDGSDGLLGRIGNDTIYGGDSIVHPEDFADEIYGGQDDDLLFGNGGNDVMMGGDDEEGASQDGNDTMFGGVGDDIILGNAGDDVLYGQIGNDSMNGGAGSDIFVFNSGSGNDVIADFEANDMLQILSGLNQGALITAMDVIEATTFFADGTALIDFGGGHTLTLLDTFTLNENQIQMVNQINPPEF